MRVIYSVAIEMATWVLFVPFELFRIATGRSSARALRERLALIRRSPDTSRRRLLVHAVSAGEMNAASALVHEMADRGWTFVLSAGNDDARCIAERIAAHHPEVERVVRFPWDRQGAMGRFLDAIRPGAVAVIETELWPNFFFACHARRIPLVIAGGRIERRAAALYRLARSFFSQLLACSDAILAINDEERDRFAGIGALPEHVTVGGELKVEACLATHAEPVTRDETRFVIVAASTHPGEESLILAAHRRTLGQVPNVRLIIAPRHVRRAAAIRRSAWRDEITIIDRMGELASLYASADIVIIGGTFVDIGGHDLLEPARCGRALVIGPYIDHIRATADAMRETHALQVTNANDLAEVLIDLLRNQAKRDRLGFNALRFVEARRGAAARGADCIEQLLSRPAAMAY